MTWKSDLEEIKKRRDLAYKMGGEEKVTRQHNTGRLTVRERIDRLLDAGSFHEIGVLAGRALYDEQGDVSEFTPANFVMGRGRIEDRPVVVGGDDFTVRGGAADAAIAQKQIMGEQFASEYRLPLVRLIEGTGGGGSVKSLDMDARTYVPANPGWQWVVENMSTVPVVSLALGPVAGLGAARTVTSHLAVMVEGVSQLFVAGPPVVNRLGESVTKEELGGADIHARNGAIDLVVASEEEAFEATRRFLSYLPSSVYDLPPHAPCHDPVDRRDEALLSIVPRNRRQVYKMRTIIEAVVDKDSFMEMGRMWGRSLITGLARLDGWPVAVMAGDPYHYGGGWTAEVSQKATRFTDIAETFHLPVVHLVDNPGFVIGSESEKAATIRHGARALASVYQASVPWCSILIRKVFGVAGAAHMNAARVHYRYAWPSGDWGSLPMEGGIEAAYKSQIEEADDPDALIKEIEERMNQVRSPFRTAEAFMVEDIIDPRDTRRLLCEFANLAAPLRTPGKSAHGMRP
ncbi:MAG: carboxyl transferase domain-containing protein [Parvularculales bacterium]